MLVTSLFPGQIELPLRPSCAGQIVRGIFQSHRPLLKEFAHSAQLGLHSLPFESHLCSQKPSCRAKPKAFIRIGRGNTLPLEMCL